MALAWNRAGFVAPVKRPGSPEELPMDLNEIASPDTATALAANQVARRYCSSALYAHSVRSYLWGRCGRAPGRPRFDSELLDVAAMLHDIGLTGPFDAHRMPFEEAGGQLAWGFGAAAGSARRPMQPGR